MAEILNDFTNIFNKGGSTATILWFTVCLFLTVAAVLEDSSLLKRIAGAGYLCMFVSFFKIGLEYQVFLFAALVVLASVRGRKKGETKNE